MNIYILIFVIIHAAAIGTMLISFIVKYKRYHELTIKNNSFIIRGKMKTDSEFTEFLRQRFRSEAVMRAALKDFWLTLFAELTGFFLLWMGGAFS